MDREDAERLLKGGQAGVGEWNQRRAGGEPIPDLEGVDLDGCDLRGVDLRTLQRSSPNRNEIMNLKGASFQRARLEGADLSGAFMLGASLEGAFLTRAVMQRTNLTEAKLAGADLKSAEMPGAILIGAKVPQAQFRNTNLQDANLTGMEGFFGDQIAGSVVAGATLPADIEKFSARETIERASSNARTIFLTMLLGCAYAVLTIGTTTDAKMITNSATSPLPIIGSQIPIVSFYVVAPIILLAFYLYFHLCMQNIWERLGTLPAVLQDGRHIDKAVDPWLLIALVRSHFEKLRDERPFLAHVQTKVSAFLAWWVVPLTLSLIWIRYLRAHDITVTILHVGLLALSSGIAIYTYRRAVSALTTVRQPAFSFKNSFRSPPYWGLLAATIICLVGTMASQRAMLGTFLQPNFEDADVSIKPSNWTGDPRKVDSELRQVKPAKLDGRNLRGLKANGAFMVRADLRRADLGHANLKGADLRGARLDGANLTGTNLEGASLTYPQVSKSCLAPTTGLPPIKGLILSSYVRPDICKTLWGD